MLLFKKKFMVMEQKIIKFSNKDLDDMTKIAKAVEDSDVLMKGITETLKNDIKKRGALPLIPMLLGTFGASLLAGKECAELVIKDKDYLEQDNE